MRKIIVIFVIHLMTNNLFGQTEEATYKTISDKFESFYNTEKYDSIFAMFSSEMQTALPLDKTIDFFNGLKTQAGQITKRQFVKYQQTYASYKTNFERGLFVLNISVDNNSKINGLFIKPFTDDSLPNIKRNTNAGPRRIGALLSFGIGLSYLSAFEDGLGIGLTAQANYTRTLNDYSAFRVDLSVARFAGKTRDYSYGYSFENGNLTLYRVKFDFLIGNFSNSTIPYAFGGFGFGVWSEGASKYTQWTGTFYTVVVDEGKSYFMTETGVGGGLIFNAGPRVKIYSEVQYSYFSFIDKGVEYGFGFGQLKGSAGVMLKLF